MATQIVLCKSSMLQGFGFDQERERLTIVFHNGSVYEYTKVPQSRVIALLSAESHGGYFTKHIKNNYGHTQLGYIGGQLKAGSLEKVHATKEECHADEA